MDPALILVIFSLLILLYWGIHFHRSVILICAVQDESPMGFIVNKPFHFSLTEVLPEIDKDLPLFYGGPVDVDQLFFIYEQMMYI